MINWLAAYQRGQMYDNDYICTIILPSIWCKINNAKSAIIFETLFAVTDKFRGLKVHLNYSLLHYSLYSNQQHLTASEKIN